MEKSDKIDRMDSKLDRLDERLDQVSITLALNTESLAEHMRRTDLLEQQVLPIKKHVDIVKYGIMGVLWVSVALAGIAGFLLTLAQLGLLKF